MLDMAMPNPSDAAPEMSGRPSQFRHRRNTGCFSLEQLRDLYPEQPQARGMHRERAQARGSPLNPRHSVSSADVSPFPESLSTSGSRVVILRSPLDSLERSHSPGSPPPSQHHPQQQRHLPTAMQYPQQCLELPVQQYSPDFSPMLPHAGVGRATRRLSQDEGRQRQRRAYASPPPARRAASEAATPELRRDAEGALQHVRGVAKSRLGQLSLGVFAPHRRCSSEVPLTDADEDSGSSHSRQADSDAVEIFFFDTPSKKGADPAVGEQAPSLADCWPMAGSGDSRGPGTPEVCEGPGPRPSSEGGLAPAQSCPAEMMKSGKARIPSVDSLRPSMVKSASVSESQLQEKPRKLKTLRSILVERDGKLQHANSLGRRVSFNSQVEVFVYL